ncbi:GNAT family N-acetyltransferase [Streptomyces sp. NPDC001922]|uniref:GNAT family N-acetyltransferase n=1 Tax=Streptomyces sp. NPDC001922 TaxID=3364624 RepID=UPI00369A4B81
MLEARRLILRRWREEDVAPRAAVNADPEVMRWIRDGSVRDEQQTRAGVQAWESEWESQGFGLFAGQSRSTGDWPGSPAFRCSTSRRRHCRRLRDVHEKNRSSGRR